MTNLRGSGKRGRVVNQLRNSEIEKEIKQRRSNKKKEKP